MSTGFDNTAPMLPGLEPPAPVAGALEVAARRTLAALAAADQLTEADALTCQLLLDLAQVVTASVRSGKASAAAMAAAQLLACQELLTAGTEDGPEGVDPFAQLVAEINAAADAEAARESGRA